VGRSRDGKWTLKEVLRHMTDDERIFAYCALCIARGEAHSLESFDENVYVLPFGEAGDISRQTMEATDQSCVSTVDPQTEGPDHSLARHFA
jgi:hypothetical protein